MIEVRGVSKSFGTRAAVTDVSFTAPAGAVTGFVGPNGAGKTTVLRMVTGLARPDAGRVMIDGGEPGSASHPGLLMGVFLSAEWIPPQVSALGFLEYVCDTQAVTRARARGALTLSGLDHVGSAPVRTFSLGMRQRLGIAAATVCHPRILVLDEPVNGLDPDGIQWFRSFIAQMARDGATVLLSSHHMSELSMVADRVVMLREGRVAAQGTLDEFVSTGATVSSVYLESPDLPRVLDQLRQRGVEHRPDGAGVLVQGLAATEVGRIAFACGAGLSHLAAVSRSLEETYFDLLTEPEGERLR
ncbi:ABC transporter ATP-binding protein [Tersicoccus sp. Bi-70]|uniref:ABC transporter ATP-binding protein n=1 Tax=Tersicoccus sp. Bi-70 TaxID=1897634 RepID=UPI000976192D|nr:ATP-binding cassette domain-containing protein [Tersicoccus sp. Bi-70]OMH32260.1 hypothetical protein BGP79_07285 [Tersicoccus sp. Bi-70]